MKPNISIAMATYNGARYVREQLESFARQSHPPFELVVCDDGSTDDTVSIVKGFARHARFKVSVHHNDVNLGFADNFLKCASLCTGNWISFSDQDDVWLENKLTRVAETIEMSGKQLALVCHSALLANDGLQLTGRRIPDYRTRKTARRGRQHGFICIPGFTITFRAALLEGIDSTCRPRDYLDRRDVALSHDKWIPLLANLIGETIYLPDNLAIYRRHNLALSGAYDAQSAADRIDKALRVSQDHYKFQVEVAADCARSLYQLAADSSDQSRRSALLDGARRYERLSHVCALRQRIYCSSTRYERLKSIGRLAGAGGYWGNRFAAYGTLSFGKDLYCAIR